MDLHNAAVTRPPYDKATETTDGWYDYTFALYEREWAAKDREETLFDLPRVPWKADEMFLNDYNHRLEKMYAPGDKTGSYVRVAILKRMLDCMKRDRAPWDGPVVWPSRADYIWCDCILSKDPSWGPHLEKEHRDERCSGSWGWDPPCGGCINCVTAQAYYYQSFRDDKMNFGVMTWLYYKMLERLRSKGK